MVFVLVGEPPIARDLLAEKIATAHADFRHLDVADGAGNPEMAFVVAQRFAAEARRDQTDLHLLVTATTLPAAIIARLRTETGTRVTTVALGDGRGWDAAEDEVDCALPTKGRSLNELYQMLRPLLLSATA